MVPWGGGQFIRLEKEKLKKPGLWGRGKKLSQSAVWRGPAVMQTKKRGRPEWIRGESEALLLNKERKQKDRQARVPVPRRQWVQPNH